MPRIKTIGILTSGGDAPGMNAAIRAVTRAGIFNGFSIKGIFRGFEGLVSNEMKPFTTENVSGIIGQGGTILKTARSKSFLTVEGRQKAYDNLVKESVDALVVIGGNEIRRRVRFLLYRFARYDRQRPLRHRQYHRLRYNDEYNYGMR